MDLKRRIIIESKIVSKWETPKKGQGKVLLHTQTFVQEG